MRYTVTLCALVVLVAVALADTTTTTSSSSSPSTILSLSGILTPSDAFYTGSVPSSKLHDDDDDDDDDDGENATQIVGGIIMGLIILAVVAFFCFAIWRFYEARKRTKADSKYRGLEDNFEDL